MEALPRGELTRRAQEIAARHYDIPDSKRISVSVDTLLDWALRYRTNGFEALAPKPRQDRGQSRALTPQLADLIERLKRENPHRTGTTLLRELALSSCRNSPGVSASTLYRFLKQRSTDRHVVPPAHRIRTHRNYLGRHAVWPTSTPRRRQDSPFAPTLTTPPPHPSGPVLSHPGLDASLDCLAGIAARGVPCGATIYNAKI